MTRHHVCAAFSLTVLMISLALLPHLRFGPVAGDLRYFHSAYDEAFYVNSASKVLAVPNRLLSAALLRAMYQATGESYDRTLILADVLFGALSMLCAMYVASGLTHSASGRCLITLLLLFGQELFSLGSSAIWFELGDPWNLSYWRHLLPPLSESIVPDYYTSYFNLFRTPEPQVGWSLFFLELGFLVRHARSKGPVRRSRIYWLVTITVSILLAYCYIFLSAAMVLLKLAYSLIAFRKQGWSLAAGVIISGALTLSLIALSVVVAPGTTSASLFRSRLPIITPSVIAGATGVVAVAVLSWRRRWRASLPLSLNGWLGALLMGLPVLLMNQQVITGVMVSTRDWERNVNYPLLLCGFFVLATSDQAWRRALPSSWPSKTAPIAAFTAVLLLAMLLIRGQGNVYLNWLPLNEFLVSAERAVTKATESTAAERRLAIIDPPGAEPQLALRSEARLRFLLDYRRVYVQPIPAIAAPEYEGSPARLFHRRSLFEFCARTGMSPEDLAIVLRQEAEARSGWYLGFLFSFADYWYPFTDNRGVRQKEILKRIDGIVTAYRESLLSPPAYWKRSAIRISGKPPEKLTANPIWRNRLLSRATAGSTSVFVYEQMPASEHIESAGGAIEHTGPD